MDSQFPFVIEDRVTAPDGPGQSSSGAAAAELEYAYWSLGMSQQYHEWLDEHVSEETALKYSAVWACVRWISQTIASVCWEQYEQQADGGALDIPLSDPISWLLEMQANPETSAFDFKQTMLNHALTGGNGYAEIEQYGSGRPAWLWQLGRGRVQPDRTAAGDLIYEVANGSGVKNTVLRPDQVFHLKGLGDDGIMGYSVVEMASRSIAIGRAEERFGQVFFARGPTPGGVLEIPVRQTKEQTRELRKQFQETYGGVRNAGRVVVISGGGKFTPLTLPNRDAQFLESRKFSVLEICRWFGVPPHKVADLERATNNNIEHQALEAVQDCLMPWCRRLEIEADLKLFGRKQVGRRFTQLDLRAFLLKGDTTTQTSAMAQQVTNGIRTVNEARAELELNPIEGGDTALIQGAMIPLRQAVNPPKPAQAPAPGPDETSADAGAIGDRARGLLVKAFGRLLRVEADKARRAQNKGKLAEHAAEYYDAAHALHIAAELQPIFEICLLAARRPPEAGAALAEASGRHHMEASRALLAAGATALEAVDGQASADFAVDRLLEAIT